MSISRFCLLPAVLLLATNVWAQEITPQDTIPAAPVDIAQDTPSPAPPTLASPSSFTYSNAYEVRAEMHKHAKLATLTLFEAEGAPGQSLYNLNGSNGLRSAHGAGSRGIVGPFAAVNSGARVWKIAQNTPSPAQPTQTNPPSFTYSNAYEVRNDIHKYASYATLPLFAAEYALGQAIYDGNGSDGLRSAHGAVSTGIVGLFAVGSVTGVWNLIEARHDPRERRLRTIHGILLLASNAGLVAAAATAPHHEGGVTPGFRNDRATHRNIAIASIGVGTVGYLIMLLH